LHQEAYEQSSRATRREEDTEWYQTTDRTEQKVLKLIVVTKPVRRLAKWQGNNDLSQENMLVIQYTYHVNMLQEVHMMIIAREDTQSMAT
jgi:hypothetical protein